MSFFRIDGPFYKFITTFWDLVKLNFCMILGCLPVVTIGASLTAAFAVTLQMAEDKDGYICRTFFKKYKENLPKGSVLGLLFLLALYALYLDSQLFLAVENHSTLFLVLGILATFMFFLCFIYAFPLLARYENSVIATIRNSYLIAVRYFVRTIFLILICVFLVLIFLWNRTLLAIGFFVAPTCIIYTISAFAIRFFREIEQEPGSISNPGEEA